MILLTPRDSDADPSRLFAVFGAGFVGTAIVDALTEAVSLERTVFPVAWEEPAERREHLRRIEGEIADRLNASERQTGRPPHLAIVWSAGVAGFQATTSEVERELECFVDVLALAVRLSAGRPAGGTVFGLVSSAGGLYEGQRTVEPESVPAPRRPYGALKLRQEQLLARNGAEMVPRVYRLTSVFGHVASGRRWGLVSTLIVNGMRRQVTHLTGRMDTLRDFVWVGDVGRFIHRDLLDRVEDRPPSPMILASTKPSSIHEIQHIVEQVLGRRIYVSFDASVMNSEDITFSPRSVAPGWVSSDLACNVRSIHLHAITNGTAFDRPAV